MIETTREGEESIFDEATSILSTGWAQIEMKSPPVSTLQ